MPRTPRSLIGQQDQMLRGKVSQLEQAAREARLDPNPDGTLRPYRPKNHTDPSDFIPSSLNLRVNQLGIPDALAELDTQLSIAADQISELYSRLAPILYPAPPDVAQCTQSDPYAESSTFAMTIANKAAIARDLNSQLTDILKRISL